MTNWVSSSPIAKRSFTAGDQEEFARLSGDRNPIHLDSRAARRTLAGKVVVHGVNGALWALENLVVWMGPFPEPALFRAQFHKFIPLDREIVLRTVRQGELGVQAELLLDGLIATSVFIGPGKPADDGLDLRGAPTEVLQIAPSFRAASEIDGARAWLEPLEGAQGATRLFPALCGWLGTDRVATIAELSSVVGMACPGLHSIFSDFAICLLDTPKERPGVGYAAHLADKRYGRVQVVVAGTGLRGELRALVRPAPVSSPAISELAQMVTQDEFAGRRALVIGGSRGLGAVTAKLLAAGGADVAVTYATGIEDADEVVADIRSHGATAQALRCDLNDPFEDAFTDQLKRASHLYYFATPHIARQAAGPFSAATFSEFNRIYVDGFHEVCRIALDRAEDRRLSAFYPSTIYIDERPKGMTEYAMSKSAGEQLCSDLARTFSGLSISAPRLPKVLTDQTANPLPMRTEDPARVMLPLLRSEQPG